MENVVILGASDNPQRYSFIALKAFEDTEYRLFLVNPTKNEIQGHRVYKSLKDIEDKIDTVTLYLSPHRSTEVIEDLISLRPRRVIFNPGSESVELEDQLRDNAIEVERACTLVLLKTNQF